MSEIKTVRIKYENIYPNFIVKNDCMQYTNQFLQVSSRLKKMSRKKQ